MREPHLLTIILVQWMKENYLNYQIDISVTNAYAFDAISVNNIPILYVYADRATTGTIPSEPNNNQIYACNIDFFQHVSKVLDWEKVRKHGSRMPCGKHRDMPLGQ